MMKDLTVVMPVYNEAECIGEVARSWLDVLGRQGMTFTLLLIDDGSTDRTAERLDALSGDARVRVIHKPNEGHGPTILNAYRMACPDSEWVFQVDSDNEIGAESFPALWAAREQADAVLGERRGRVQSAGRRMLSLGSFLLVRLLSGPIPRDTNVPFRLLRSATLAPLLDRIPADTFAPNVAITGLVLMKGARLRVVPVQNRERRTGQTSLVSWKIVRVAGRSLSQVGRILWRCRRKL